MKNMDSEAKYAAERILMVKEQLRNRGLENEQVFKAFETVPRELFVDKDDMDNAYLDRPLSIGHRQTISQPFIVALTCEALDIQPSARVLEIGTGSGYQTAILSMLGKVVVSVERIHELYERAERILNRLGIMNVVLYEGDGSVGVPNAAEFDAIAVSAAMPKVPLSLFELLNPGGKMVVPVGGNERQELLLVVKDLDGKSLYKKLCDCRFVPLIGKYGFIPK